ncbi:intradiol ring-cleavage dioxygenase [Streptomyces sp. ADMS]|uniref:intradiol ring-cleavage dioxygenase n=1 Tax=Streptomyces sp. ADMS TaxID=3071415 RepID=UPI00296F9D14|nr:intradiol ring-cleavage dioxygenase [Streptomyces sp. ADMS]MDW4904764.1 intradiol ring-cleavage dioxygenase [Streptomyces sp. ADMS]
MTDTPQQEFPQQGTAEQRELTRRRVVVAGGATAVTATAVALGTGLASAQGAPEAKGAHAPGSTPSGPLSGTPSGTPEACYVLTTETTEGPYYIDADKLRQDVTEDEKGIPLTLRLKVIDSETCRPVRNAAVDIWHCSALGVYSGYEAMGNGGGGGGGTPPSGAPTDVPTGPPPSDGPGGPGGHQEPTDDERYLRGTWKTDRRGHVTFRTVFPGWYRGRCVHIHVKVHVDGTWTDAGYEGGRTCHTGQLFFDEESVLLSAVVAPYSTNTATRTTLDEDTIYPDNGAEGGLLRLKYKKRDIGRGVLAELTMGVVPDDETE